MHETQKHMKQNTNRHNEMQTHATNHMHLERDVPSDGVGP